MPIINENDTVATEEIKFGDNDQLAALVCNLVSADALIILTDVEGVRDASGVRMPIVRDIDREAAPVAGGIDERRRLGRHGEQGRLGAHRHAHRRARDRRARPRARRARARARRRRRRDAVRARRRTVLSARKHWIAYGAKPAGKLVVDDGAARALRDGGKSLLPAGIVAVDGDFELGDTVCDHDARRRRNRPWSRRLTRPTICARSRACNQPAIEARLGYKSIDEAIHRDDLVIL